MARLHPATESLVQANVIRLPTAVPDGTALGTASIRVKWAGRTLPDVKNGPRANCSSN